MLVESLRPVWGSVNALREEFRIVQEHRHFPKRFAPTSVAHRVSLRLTQDPKETRPAMLPNVPDRG